MVDPKLYEPFERKLREVITTYQQNFIFIDSIRGGGKTFSLQKILLDLAFKLKLGIGWMFRSQDEYLKQDGLYEGWTKVIDYYIPDVNLSWSKDECWVMKEVDGKLEEDFMLLKAFAIRNKIKIKRKRGVKIFTCVLDEYTLERGDEHLYVKGYNEPDELLSIYHSLDGEADKLKMIFLGNTTRYYNPYHLHPAFKSVFARRPAYGQMNKSENAVFWFYKPDDALMEAIKETKFSRMIEGTDYGNYAVEGEYDDDVRSVEKMPAGAKCRFGLRYKDVTVYLHDSPSGYCWLSLKGDPAVTIYGVRANDLGPDDMLFRYSAWADWFDIAFNRGKIYFSDHKTKSMASDFLYEIVSGFRKMQ